MSEYPRDEELELLIEKLEREELYAPGYMKEQILSHAFQEEAPENFPIPAGRRQRTVIFIYRLKIVAGMAAALFMLMLLPYIGESREDEAGRWDSAGLQQQEQEADGGREERGINVNSMLGEQTRQIDRKLNGLIEWLGSFPLQTLNDIGNGGVNDEN